MKTAQTDEQLALAKQAAEGIADARRRVNALVHPVIEFQTGRFCKRFCRENRQRYRCTLKPPWGSPREDAGLCEWGNASYAWMLDDLTGSRRLTTYRGEKGSSLYNYLYRIANSLPFYERWKDWRFNRRVHVPAYIQQMGPTAAKVFLALRAKQEIRAIAEAIGTDRDTTEKLCREIIAVLTKKRRLHLLDPVETVSLTQSTDTDGAYDTAADIDIASYDEPAEQVETRARLSAAWQQLNAVEQYVIEALVIEDQDANDVLAALRKLGIELKSGVAAEDTDRQQLYYFRRKTLAKIAALLEAKKSV
jgi:hypothetical protein